FFGGLFSSMGPVGKESFDQCSFGGHCDSYLGDLAGNHQSTGATEYEYSFTLEPIGSLVNHFLPVGSDEKDFFTRCMSSELPRAHGDPLYGGGGKGGSRTRKRLRTENTMKSQLSALATAVAELQTKLTGQATAPTVQPRAKAKAEPRRRREPTELLILTRLRSLLGQIENGGKINGKPITQAQVVNKLREVLATFSINVPAWDSLETPGGASPSSPAKQRLVNEPWGTTKIIAASTAKTSMETETAPLVVLALSAAEYEANDRVRKAMGNRTDITTFVLDPQGPEVVLVEGPKGPVKMKVQIYFAGDQAPRRTNLHAKMTDDSPIAPEKLTLATFRITVVEEFAAEAIYQQAKNEPHTILAAVLGDSAAEKVLRTRGAISYESEAACVVTVPTCHADAIKQVTPPVGCFVMPQSSKEVPKWFSRRDDEEGEAHCTRVSQLVHGRRGALLYRPHHKAQLGVVSSIATAPGAAELTKWFVKHAPPNWLAPTEMMEWATGRGFLRVAQASRAGPRAWAFFADAPDGVPATTFSFSSGMVVTRALARTGTKPTKAKDDEGGPARNRWGAPKPTPQAEPPEQFPEEEGPPAAPSGGAAAAADTGSTWGARNLRQRLPKASLMRSAAEAKTAVPPTARAPPAKDFEPEGRLQGALRLPAQSLALKKKFNAAAQDAEAIGLTGQGNVAEAHHYEWLDPKEGVTDLAEFKSTLKLWRGNAFPYPAVGLQGKGLDEDAMSLLGLSLSAAGPAGAGSAGAGRAQSAKAKTADPVCSKGAASVLGLQGEFKGMMEGLDLDYAARDCYKCTRGWPAPWLFQGRTAAQRLSAATKHWRECQGMPPPKITKMAHSAIGKFMANAPHIRENKRKRQLAGIHQWIAKLPVKVRAGVCDLNPASVTDMPRAYGVKTGHRCLRCGIVREASHLAWAPCSKRPASLTRLQYLTSTVGRTRAKRILDLETRRRKKWRATPECKSAAAQQQRQDKWEQYAARADVAQSRRLLNKAMHKKKRTRAADKNARNARRRALKQQKRVPAASLLIAMLAVHVGPPGPLTFLSGLAGNMPKQVRMLDVHLDGHMPFFELDRGASLAGYRAGNMAKQVRMLDVHLEGLMPFFVLDRGASLARYLAGNALAGMSFLQPRALDGPIDFVTVFLLLGRVVVFAEALAEMCFQQVRTLEVPIDFVTVLLLLSRVVVFAAALAEICSQQVRVLDAPIDLFRIFLLGWVASLSEALAGLVPQRIRMLDVPVFLFKIFILLGQVVFLSEALAGLSFQQVRALEVPIDFVAVFPLLIRAVAFAAALAEICFKQVCMLDVPIDLFKIFLLGRVVFLSEALAGLLFQQVRALEVPIDFVAVLLLLSRVVVFAAALAEIDFQQVCMLDVPIDLFKILLGRVLFLAAALAGMYFQQVCALEVPIDVFTMFLLLSRVVFLVEALTRICFQQVRVLDVLIDVFAVFLSLRRAVFSTEVLAGTMFWQVLDVFMVLSEVLARRGETSGATESKSFANAPGPCSRFLQVATLNVTALRKDRSGTILGHQALKHVDVLLLQEVRLASSTPGWVISTALRYGWRAACSTPPNRNAKGVLMQGGAAIFWKPSLGQAAVRRGSHRYVAIRVACGTFVSAHGPASCASVPWMEEQRVYDGVDMCEAQSTTVMNTAPTRALAKGAALMQLSSQFVEGIPYHALVTYQVGVLHAPRTSKPLKLKYGSVYLSCPAPTLFLSDGIDGTREQSLLCRLESPKGGLLDQFVRECLRGYIDVDGSGVPSYGRAHDLVSKSIIREQGRLQKQVLSDWKQLLKTFTPEAWKAASGALKPSGECPSFTANDMAKEWKQIWCPPSTFDGKQCAEQWKWYASQMREPLPTSTCPADWVPTYADFVKAVKKGKGGAGYDGWHSSELKLMASQLEFFVRELYDLWCDTCFFLAEAGLASEEGIKFGRQDALRELQRLLFCWRVVGAPRKVGLAALHKSGTPQLVTAVAHAAWTGPRICQVAGGLADEEIWPTRSLAQGDSCAPRVLCEVLSPWTTHGTKFLFMDDRSLVCSSEAQLDSDIQSTNEFDTGTGAIENESKRQHWVRGRGEAIEHVGILDVPDDPDVDITPGAGLSKLHKRLEAIRGLPGSAATRSRAVGADAKPLRLWCCPVFSLAPPQATGEVMRAVLRTKRTWWCKGRFWALNFNLHPVFTA
ncbi:unnamed protein product, partial [Prorocentrum cordatum]